MNARSPIPVEAAPAEALEPELVALIEALARAHVAEDYAAAQADLERAA